MGFLELLYEKIKRDDDLQRQMMIEEQMMQMMKDIDILKCHLYELNASVEMDPTRMRRRMREMMEMVDEIDDIYFPVALKGLFRGKSPDLRELERMKFTFKMRLCFRWIFAGLGALERKKTMEIMDILAELYWSIIFKGLFRGKSCLGALDLYCSTNADRFEVEELLNYLRLKGYSACCAMNYLNRIYESKLFMRWSGINGGRAKADILKLTKRKYRKGLPAGKRQNTKKECRTFNSGPSGALRQPELKQTDRLEQQIKTQEEYLKTQKRYLAKLKKSSKLMKKSKFPEMENKVLRKKYAKLLMKISVQKQEKGVEELLKMKSVMEVIENLMDRVNRRMEKDRMADLQSCEFMLTTLPIFYAPKQDYSDIHNWQYLSRFSYFEIRNTKIKEYEGKGMPSELETMNEIKQWMEEDKRDIQGPQRKLSWAFREYSIRATATDGPAADEGQESWQTPGSGQKSIVQDVIELEKKLFVNNKKAVKFSDYEGLEEALLEAPRGEIPKYLQDIAKKIRNACVVTETENVLQSSLILFCAAVHEMDYVGLELFNWDRLLTWGATYNKVKDAGLEVKFVEQHLKKILYAYLGYDFKKEIDPTARIQNLEAELKVIEHCMSAKKFFEGNRLSHGLFP